MADDSVLLRAAGGHRHGDGRGSRKLRRTMQTVKESMQSWLQRGRSQMLVRESSDAPHVMTSRRDHQLF